MNLTCMPWTSVSTAFKTRVCEQDLTDKECCASSHIKWRGCVHTSLFYFWTKLTVPQMNLFFDSCRKWTLWVLLWANLGGGESVDVRHQRFCSKINNVFHVLLSDLSCFFFRKRYKYDKNDCIRVVSTSNTGPWWILVHDLWCHSSCSQTHEQKLAKSTRLSTSLTIPGQRCRRKCCSVHLDLAGQTHCARYWGATHILGLSTPFWLLGRRSTSFVGSSDLPSHSAHREDNRWIYE